MEDESSTTPRKSKPSDDLTPSSKRPATLDKEESLNGTLSDPVYRGLMVKTFPVYTIAMSFRDKQHVIYTFPLKALSVVASTKALRSERIVWEMEHKVDHEYDYFFKIVLNSSLETPAASAMEFAVT
ncbi:hypothetical protein QJS10_CPB15g01276 [Acorus calamus]|uniref:Uncharacterized protein n=1 Tax=Acorus calamus TaxID=4465 RepID=A0AAV9D654_ACOCL|nr:hypothetical protein QJS10_CPB15g01276 [Acorus calamus]